ncbi:nucleotidyltransferase domain-containing protein [Quadrisphaera setariae]|uniref:Amino acid transporter n=1 Tax=Quadrisphaera setariae TaxID=2593304 RepID=A0A5C8ZI07_9ACTN|nr:amino acid transporter [Quadrisphaera setariae]TXR56801.1 amino acid transporter [Quadrisphaera setariae]
MTASTALDLLRLFERAGIEVWVDGGWGVDALLGEQTRPHADLDVVVLVADVPRARELLAEAGFAILREWLPTALAVRHPDGREVDLHPVTPTADGGGDQELFAPDPPFHYGPPSTGHLDGVEVACVSAESQLRAHQGYEPQPEDRADVLALATRFGLPLPEAYGTQP